MVINLRVKTLDSQDHEFSVEDDVSSGLIFCFNTFYGFVEYYILFINVVVHCAMFYSKAIKNNMIYLFSWK